MRIAAEDEHEGAADEDGRVEEARRGRRGEETPLARLVRIVRVEAIGEDLVNRRLGHVAAVHVDEIRMRIMRGAVTVAAFHGETYRLNNLPLACTEVVLLHGVEVAVLRRVAKDDDHLLLLVVALYQVRCVPSNLSMIKMSA